MYRNIVFSDYFAVMMLLYLHMFCMRIYTAAYLILQSTFNNPSFLYMKEEEKLSVKKKYLTNLVKPKYSENENNNIFIIVFSS